MLSAELNKALLQTKSNVSYPPIQISSLISLLRSEIHSYLISELKPSARANRLQSLIPIIQHFSTLPDGIRPIFRLLIDLGYAILAVQPSRPFLPSLYCATSVSATHRAQGVDSEEDIIQALISTDEALLALSMRWWASRTPTSTSIEASDVSAAISSIEAERQKHGLWLNRDYFARSYTFLRAAARIQAIEMMVWKVAGEKLPPELTDQIQSYLSPPALATLVAASQPVPSIPDCEDPACVDQNCPNKMRLQWDAKLLRFKRVHDVVQSQGGWECHHQSVTKGGDGCKGHCGTLPPYFGPHPMGPYLEEVMQEIIYTATRRRYIPPSQRRSMSTYQKTAWDIGLKEYEQKLRRQGGVGI